MINLLSLAAVVLVELFTSEGCSSCPPADAILEKLDHAQPLAGIQVVVLSEHVDYWNRIGWKDPFSNSAFSRRQEQYARRFRLDSVYTPQLVVDGRTQTVGNDERSVYKAIREAANERKAGVRIRLLPTHVEIESDGAEGGVMMLASADSATAVSKVLRGENSGRELRHVAVVRSLKEVGSVTKGEPFTATIAVKEGTRNKRWIAFIQEKDQGHILGVAEAK